MKNELLLDEEVEKAFDKIINNFGPYEDELILDAKWFEEQAKIVMDIGREPDDMTVILSPAQFEYIVACMSNCNNCGCGTCDPDCDDDDDLLDEIDDQNGYNPFAPDSDDDEYYPKLDEDECKDFCSKKKKVKCECGVESAGGGIHSDWCPKYKKD